MFAPFILLVLLLLGLPFISLCPSPEALLTSLCLLIFRSLPKPSQFPSVPGINHPCHYYLVFPALFWAEHLCGKPHSCDEAGKELRFWEVVFLKCQFSTRGGAGRGNFIINCRDIYTVYFINPKSQALSRYHHCLPWTGPISHLCSPPIS